MFHLQETWSYSQKLPYEKEKLGKRDGTLTLTVDVDAVQEKDGDALAGPAESRPKESVETAVEEKLADAGVQVDEDSLPGDVLNEPDLSANENFPVDSVLLCVEGCLNGISVIFLIDSGASVNVLWERHLLKRMD